MIVNIRRRWFFSIAFAMTLSAVVTGFVGADEPKLKALLKDRLVTARELADLTAKAFKGGEVSAVAVYEANMTVLDVEMDMCETDGERYAVQNKIVAEAKKHE